MGGGVYDPPPYKKNQTYKILNQLNLKYEHKMIIFNHLKNFSI